jgi:threonine synthase
MVAVTEDALLEAVGTLAARAGVAAEPAGAAALAGLGTALATGLVDPRETVVLLVTGREKKAGSAPVDAGRRATAERLEDVERALGASPW